MSALEQWHRKLREGKRTTTTFDDLWRAACRAVADLEFEAQFGRPAREHVATLRAASAPATHTGPRRKRTSLARWELALRTVEES